MKSVQTQTVKVSIANQEYKLRTDNPDKAKHIASEVDNSIQQLRRKVTDPSTQTLSILTALNFAEQKHEHAEQQEVDKEFVSAELAKMSKLLRKSYQDHLFRDEQLQIIDS